jgi:hypothetical protein
MSGRYNLALHEFKLAVGEDRAHASLAKIIRRNGSHGGGAAQFAAAPMIKPSDSATNDLEATEILAEIFSSSQPVSAENQVRAVRESRDEAAAQFAGAVMITPSDRVNNGEKTEEILANIFTAGRPASTENHVISESQHNDVHGQVVSAIKIEVSNGNGVNRMARRVGEYLRSKGFLPVRLTNAENFNQPKTRIYYSRGYHDEACKLAFHLPENHGIEMISRPPIGNAVIRVVIGKDIAPYRSLFQNS